MKQGKTNIAHSVRDRLMKISLERDENYQLILIKYALERFLYRLQNSIYVEKFVLKGAFLFTLWTKEYYRPTRDLDFLARTSNQAEEMSRIFKEICDIEVDPDGLIFDSAFVSIAEIMEGTSYRGLRIKLTAYLDKIRIPLQFDIGFGDAVYPDVETIEYPSLLDYPNPRILAYPLESLISEKVEAMVDLGIQNSRMKDFYDIYSLSKIFDIDTTSLQKAIAITFERRKTKIPEDIPIALTDEFAYDKDKVSQWRQFINKNDLSNAPDDLFIVIDEIRNFLLPIFNALNNEKD